MKRPSGHDAKPGRNDPCHCGNGVKYKKFCIDKDRESEAVSQDAKPINRSLEIARAISKIGKIAKSKNMSIEDMNKYFVGRTFDEIYEEAEECGDFSSKERAQDIIYEAFEEPVAKKRRKLVEQALAVYPHLPDAWTLMAEEASTPEEALSCYERAVSAGERDLGEDFFKENRGRFWGIVETRPYMRAKLCLADTLWWFGREDEAIAHYQDCLILNPNDNQGIRDVLLTCLLIKNNLDDAGRILDCYKDDGGAHHAFSKTLLLFKKHGPESKKLVKQIASALEDNPHVPKYLLGKLKLPSRTPDLYSCGSKEEAIIYTTETKRAWKEIPGALDWLKTHVLGIRRRIP